MRINGAPIDAATPFRINEAPPGEYYVQISKQGFRDIEKAIIVKSNKTAEWYVELIQTAVRVEIDIDDGLENVGIMADGKALGVAPGYFYLEPGNHLLTLEKSGYEPFKTSR